MKFLDFLKKKNEMLKADDVASTTNNQETKSVNTQAVVDDFQDILEQESLRFFPETGIWFSGCFSRPNDVAYAYLPCHLRDNLWLSKLMWQNLSEIGVDIPLNKIRKFVSTSENFQELRHAYELEIVKWQIDFIKNGGENWLAPKGYDEASFLFGEDVDKIIRGGVSRTLQSIGMNYDVIEEGLEKYSDEWRPSSMMLGFKNKFEKPMFLGISPEPASWEHRQNWLANREYKYYLEHKDSVDKYGTPTSAMKMTPEEHRELISVLNKQNNDRLEYINELKKNSGRDSKEFHQPWK